MWHILRQLIFRNLSPVRFATFTAISGVCLILCVAFGILMVTALVQQQFPEVPVLSELGIDAASTFPVGVGVGVGTLGAALVFMSLVGLIQLYFFQRMRDSGQPIWVGIASGFLSLMAITLLGVIFYNLFMGGTFIKPKRVGQLVTAAVLLLPPAIFVATLRPRATLCAVK